MGNTPLPSPSALERVAMCLASETLPQIQAVSTDAARKGTIIHRFLQRCLDVGRDVALCEADEEDMAMLECLDVAKLPASQRESYSAELALAYNPWTEECRVLGQDIERQETRDLAVSRGMPLHLWMVGTVDVAGIENADTALCWDYKSGRGKVTKAAFNWQTWTYLLMVARAFDLRRARGGIIRTNETTTLYDECVMDQHDLTLHAAQLRQLLENRAAALDARQVAKDTNAIGSWIDGLIPFEGPHCTYCPAKDSCRPVLSSMIALAEGRLDALGPLTPDHRSLAWQRAKTAQKMLDTIVERLKTHAKETPIQLGDGRIVAERLKTGNEVIIPTRAKPALAEQLGDDLGAVVFGSAAKTTESLTKDALRKALARYGPEDVPKSRFYNDVLLKLRERGAVATSDARFVVDEHDEPAAAA